MKVLLLTREYPPKFIGGVGRYVSDLARGLAAQGDSVWVVTFSAPGQSYTHLDGNLNVHWLEVPHSELIPTDPSFYLRVNRQIVRWANQLSSSHWTPDVIHINSEELVPAAIQLSRQQGRRPIVTTFHSLVYQQLLNGINDNWEETRRQNADVLARIQMHPVMSRMVKGEMLCCQASERIICISQYMKGLLRQIHQVSEKKLRLVYHGTDVERFSHRDTVVGPEYVRRRFADPDEWLILFVGRLAPQKGLAFLIEALDGGRLCVGAKKVKLVVAGEGGGYDTSQLLARRNEQILFVGALPTEKLIPLYQVADVLVMPSIYEPLGLVALEGMACGVPVVATDVDGLDEIVKDGVDGLKVPVRVEGGERRVDVRRLREAIVRVLCNRALRDRLGQNAFRKVREGLSIQACVNNTRSVYTEAIDGNSH